MDFNQLEYILAISECRTLIAAADKLSISPSALSQFISKLEAEVQTPLFKRTKSGWIPTIAGQIYIDMAKDVLNRRNRAYLQLSDITDGKTGQFSIGVTPGRGIRMFSAVYPQFKALFPNEKIVLFFGTIGEIVPRVAAGTIDLGFVTDKISLPELSSRNLITEELVLVVPKRHRLAYLATQATENELASVDLTLFKNDEFILAPAESDLRRIENNAFVAAGFAPNIVQESSNLETTNLLAQAGYGITFLPSFYVSDHSESVYFKTNPAIPWTQVVAYRKDSYITKAEDCFISLAESYYKNQNRNTK